MRRRWKPTLHCSARHGRELQRVFDETGASQQNRDAVDMETGAVLALTLQDANAGDTTTIEQTLIPAAEQLERLEAEPETAK